ncbi:YdcF family protein [Bacillus salacetis]|uniref:YdcF family protein n=1 Tax=Bacillus salacetis TaxID=2315464 RepID=A0A3A1RAU8_9BACI|nr:YdcF family protein [Bacillus salacetis]RIW38521.1 YdcF family protein [Bacillus salacetis]
MKPIISKEAAVPKLNERKISDLTEIVFGKRKEVKRSNAMFIFSGTHPGHWTKAIEAFEMGLCRNIIVTGGKSPTAVPHPEWIDGSRKEAHVIISHLLNAGIPRERIVYEDRSTNSLENVLYAKEVYDFTVTEQLLYICKSHAAGRQERTLRKHLGEGIEYIPFSFDAEYNGIKVNRETWSLSDLGRKRVWGEFLRILTYGEAGDISPLEKYNF